MIEPIKVSGTCERKLEDVVAELCLAVYELSQRITKLEQIAAPIVEKEYTLTKPEPPRDDPEEDRRDYDDCR